MLPAPGYEMRDGTAPRPEAAGDLALAGQGQLGKRVSRSGGDGVRQSEQWEHGPPCV